MEADLQRRFGGISRLYGDLAGTYLRKAHLCVVGVGGVGSWTAEALARSGVGRLTLIDLDMVAESNTNRQVHALGSHFGRAKVDVMAERIRDINPVCEVLTIEDFVTPENVATLLSDTFDGVIDAIDQVRAKAALIAHCCRHKVPIVSAGAAGGQIDPTLVTSGDLAHTTQDPLLAKVRSRLRRDYGFPRDGKKKFGVTAVFSTEQMRHPHRDACTPQNSSAGLNCSGFGSSVAVTGTFGFAAAAAMMKRIVSPRI